MKSAFRIYKNISPSYFTNFHKEDVFNLTKFSKNKPTLFFFKYTAQQQQQQPPPPAQSNGVGGAGRRGPGSIKWTKEGVSTSAERRLPFVHRFRPVGLPPPTGILESGNSTNSPGSGGPLPQGQQQQQQGQQQQQSNYHKKVTNKMSQYDTNPVGALQERYQSRGILPL